MMIAGYDFPKKHLFDFAEPDGEVRVEFRLVYQGPLPADKGDGGRSKYKHKIRKHFHIQLKELWGTHPDLVAQSSTLYVDRIIQDGDTLAGGMIPGDRYIYKVRPESNDPRAKSWVDHIADSHARLGGRFVPLINEASGFTCALDILFLRRDAPGGLIRKGAQGGDIDNRIKTLLDGLTQPSVVQDLGGMPIDASEDPFFVLLEDDSLITSIGITTDRLMVPQEQGEKMNDVYLVVHVKMVNPSIVFSGNRLV